MGSGIPHVPTEKTRSQVLALKSFGHTVDELCTYLDICVDTLYRHYRREMDIAQVRANSEVANKLYKKAVEQEELGAITFWLKTRARWREVKHDDDRDSLIEKLVNKLKDDL